MIVFQSLAMPLRPCPSGTFANSQQHARVIYGWIHRPPPTQSPAGTTEVLSYHAGLRLLHPSISTFEKISVYQRRLAVKKSIFYQTNPFRKIHKPMRINQKHKNLESFWPKNEPIFSGSGGVALKKYRNCETNPIFSASCFPSIRSKEKFPNFMISKTHHQSERAHGGNFPFKVSQDHSRLLKVIQAYSRDFEEKIIYYFRKAGGSKSA